jgi:hypothetical protein
MDKSKQKTSTAQQQPEDQYADRKKLTFEQAEGAEPLPTQLKLKELSPLLRSAIWAAIYRDMADTQYRGALSDFWEGFTHDWHVYRAHRPADEYSPSFEFWTQEFKTIVFAHTYTDLLGLLQRILRTDHPQFNYRCPQELRRSISSALEIGRAAYRVVDGDTIVPMGSITEVDTLGRAFADLAASEFHGARKHLRSAAEQLNAAHNADSIRESIHAVESIISVLEPKGDFAKALAKLDGKVKIHGAMKSGFTSLYGFTSNEEGIRHPLLDKDAAQVDETDALFMIGACSAFVSYLINKARTAGLLSNRAT